MQYVILIILIITLLCIAMMMQEVIQGCCSEACGFLCSVDHGHGVICCRR